MKEIIESLRKWQAKGNKTAIATIVGGYGSAPRPLGSKMAVNDLMEFAGSVSGGCIEGDVIRNALRVIKEQKPALLRYGISTDAAWDIGLACGGEIEIFLEPLHPIDLSVFDFVEKQRLCATVTVLSGERIGYKLAKTPNGIITGAAHSPDMDTALLTLIDQPLQQQISTRSQMIFQEEQLDVFIDVFSPPARLIIVGAVHIAIPLVKMAKILGFKTIVLDSRSAFATTERFPHTDELIVGWPADILKDMRIDENTFIACLSHDEKMDLPALAIALDSKARYIGVLGSKKTHAKRVESLAEMWISQTSIARIHAPIGLSIGAVGVEEIALSVVAEIVALRNGKIA